MPVASKKQRKRTVEQAVSYAIGHRIRIEVLAALHEGPASTAELTKMIGQPLSTVTHHVEELLKSGSIEVASTQQIGNFTQYFYRMTKIPFYSDEEWAELSPEERQVTAALILQASMAEALAALWAGKLHSDPRVMIAWNRIQLDAKGREDLADEQQRSWERMREIEAEATERRVESGAQGVTYVVTSFGFERCRNSPPPPLLSGKG